MMRFSWIASAFAFAILAGCATNGPSASLRQVADQVDAARAAAGKKDFSKIPPLAASVPTLNSVIAANSDGSLAAAAHYYRAEIALLTNSQNFRAGLPADPALTQEAVTEYGKTLLYGQNMPEWKIYLLDVAYRRGAAANTGGLFDVALDSFKLCAGAGHPGCMNAAAGLLLKGPQPSEQNLAESFRLFQAAAGTGILAQCAGSFSASSVALFIHFKVVKEATGDELEWMRLSRKLAYDVQKATSLKDPCDQGGIALTEFLMRTDAGDERPEILEDVAHNAASPSNRALAEYLAGRLDEVGLRTRLSEEALSPSDRCDIEFDLLWNDVRVRRTAAAQMHFEALNAVPSQLCFEDRFYAGKLGFPPRPSS